MTLTVRMDTLLEKQMEQAAKQRGISKSQFAIEAIERMLGYKNPYDLLMAIRAEKCYEHTANQGFVGDMPYEQDTAKDRYKRKLMEKHNASSIG